MIWRYYLQQRKENLRSKRWIIFLFEDLTLINNMQSVLNQGGGGSTEYVKQHVCFMTRLIFS